MIQDLRERMEAQTEEIQEMFNKKLEDLTYKSVAQRLKSLPARQENRVRSQRQEDPLEKEIATHYSILARRIPWTEEPGGLQFTGSQRVRHNRATSLSL